MENHPITEPSPDFVVAIVVAPFFSIDLEPIEWDSVDIDNTNYTPDYGVYE